MKRASALLALALIGAACSSPESKGEGPPEVVAAIYPLAYVTERVGGDLTRVSDLTPAGAEPHDVELTPQQVVTLSRADLVVFIGGGFQPSLDDSLGSAEGVSLDARDPAGSSLLPDDPHLWLDPLILADVGDAVARSLADLSPDDADSFERSASELRRDLEDVHERYETTLASCDRSEIVTAHDAFGYVAARYGLEAIPIAGIDPASEPSAGRLAEIAGLAQELSVTTIFTESLVSPRVAETVAAEAGVETAVLDPLESKPEDTDLLGAMEENLEVLAEALGCRG